MTGYLTNTDLKNEDRCKYAAKQSGLNVRFRRHPMPKDPFDPEMENYFPEKFYGVYGSVYTNENPNVCHGVFWDYWYAWDRIVGR